MVVLNVLAVEENLLKQKIQNFACGADKLCQSLTFIDNKCVIKVGASLMNET